MTGLTGSSQHDFNQSSAADNKRSISPRDSGSSAALHTGGSNHRSSTAHRSARLPTTGRTRFYNHNRMHRRPNPHIHGRGHLTVNPIHAASRLSRRSANESSSSRHSTEYGDIIQGEDFFSIPESPPRSRLTLPSQRSDIVNSNPAYMMHQADLPRGDYTHHVTLAVEPAANHRGKPVPSSWTISVVRFEGVNVEQYYRFDVHDFVVSKYKHPTDVLERIWVLLNDTRNVVWRAMYGALRICISTNWGYERYRTHCLMPLAWLFYRWAFEISPNNGDPVIIAYYNRHVDWWLLSASTVPDLVRGNTVAEFHQDLLSRAR